jgi:Niemann-Pick C1 protein
MTWKSQRQHHVDDRLSVAEERRMERDEQGGHAVNAADAANDDHGEKNTRDVGTRGANAIMTRYMERWGAYVATSPKQILIMMSIIASVSMAGLSRVRIETDPIQLWVAESSLAYQERARYGELFMPFYRTNQVILRPKDGGSIARPDILSAALTLQEKIATLTAPHANGTAGT